ncbi:MAG: hypothetical protein U9R01_07055, partial [candidate division WOR-3 bacterium]|nr:hypothetical protein [candidate division WOR-3 bacterium]
MATGFELFAKIIPDTSELDKVKNKDIEIKTKTEGMGKKLSDLFGGKGGGGIPIGTAPAGAAPGGAGAAPGGAGAALGGGVAGGVLLGMGIFGILKKIVGFLAGLEPIQAIMSLVGAIMKMFFLPLAMMLFNLLRPILIPMVKLMPMWLQFWQDPIGKLRGLGDMLWDALIRLGKWIVEGIKSCFVMMYITIPMKILEGIMWLGGQIWDYFKDLPGQIWDYMVGIGDWLADLPGQIW